MSSVNLRPSCTGNSSKKFEQMKYSCDHHLVFMLPVSASNDNVNISMWMQLYVNQCFVLLLSSGDFVRPWETSPKKPVSSEVTEPSPVVCTSGCQLQHQYTDNVLHDNHHRVHKPSGRRMIKPSKDGPTSSGRTSKPSDRRTTKPSKDDLTSSGITRSRQMKPSRHLSPKSLDMMECWYKQHSEHPYPSNEIIYYIARHGQITPAQVRKWMANKRVRCFNTLAFNGAIHPKRLKRLARESAMRSQTTAHPHRHQQPYRYPVRPIPQHLTQFRSSFVEHQPTYLLTDQKYTQHRYSYPSVNDVAGYYVMPYVLPTLDNRTSQSS